MLLPSLTQIIPILLRYKYWIIFPISVVEGPIISILSGFLVAGGILNPVGIFLILVLGDVMGDGLYYAIGRWGGRRFIHRWGHLFRLNEDSLLYVEKHFQNHPVKTLLFGKAQALGSVILAVAGIAKMPFLKFLWLNFLGTCIKTAMLLCIGYYFGQAYLKIDRYLNYIGLTITFVSVLIIIYLILKNKKWKK